MSGFEFDASWIVARGHTELTGPTVAQMIEALRAEVVRLEQRVSELERREDAWSRAAVRAARVLP